MKDNKVTYVKRTQRDYSLSFKLQVVTEVEKGELSITGAACKYGIQSKTNSSINSLSLFLIPWE